MGVVKTFSVGEGDMFYIKHGNDNFTVIDCCLDDDNKELIVDEIKNESKDKGICRFISTHPDEDHIQGLPYLNENWGIINFYVVKNEATKSDETDSFEKYCELRDSDKAFHIYKGCSRCWMNQSNDERGSAGIHILWPNTSNSDFKEELKKVKGGNSPNNISPIFFYSCGKKFMWMGDIETTFLEKVKDDIEFSEIDVLFAPHHGRESGKVPEDILKILNPKIIVIGEAPSGNINYYQGYNTITQNTAGDITFEATSENLHVYVSSDTYSVNFLTDYNVHACQDTKFKFSSYELLS